MKLMENLDIVFWTWGFSLCPLFCLLNENSATTTTVYVFQSLWHNETQSFEVSEKRSKKNENTRITST